jgi:hypothetical protein
MCISAWQHKVFAQKGIYFSVTLWPPASAHFDAIEEDIAREYAVTDKTDYIYSDDEFEQISRAICTSDDISEWKLLRKQHYMYKGVNQLRQMTIHVPAPTWRKKERGKSLCVEMEALKKKLRSKYKTYVPSYVQDILIHITDNTLQSETVNKLFM